MRLGLLSIGNAEGSTCANLALMQAFVSVLVTQSARLHLWDDNDIMQASKDAGKAQGENSNSPGYHTYTWDPHIYIAHAGAISALINTAYRTVNSHVNCSAHSMRVKHRRRTRAWPPHRCPAAGQPGDPLRHPPTGRVHRWDAYYICGTPSCDHN